MDLTLRFLGLALVISFGRDESEGIAEAYHLGTTDHSFGFAPETRWFARTSRTTATITNHWSCYG